MPIIIASLNSTSHMKQGGKLVIPSYIQRKGNLGKPDALEKWQKIEHAIHQIYKQNASSLSFQVLYT